MSPGLVRGVDRHRRDHFVLGIGRTLEDHVDLAGGEAGERKVEIDVEHRQFAELELQEIEVPAGAERDLVVGEPERALLRLREMRQRDRRHLGHAERLRGEQPAVPGDDDTVRVDQDSPRGSSRCRAQRCSSRSRFRKSRRSRRRWRHTPRCCCR